MTSAFSSPRDARSRPASSTASILLVMDMAKCIRCGNCSLACHKVHGQSRLVRRGIHIERPVKPTRSRDAERARPVGLHALPGPRMPDRLPDRRDRPFSRRRDRYQSDDLHRLRRLRDAVSVQRDLDDRASRCRANNGNEGMIARVASVFSLGEAQLPAAGRADREPARRQMQSLSRHPLNPPGAKREAYSCEENCPTGALVRVNPREYFDEVNRHDRPDPQKRDARDRREHSQVRLSRDALAHRRPIGCRDRRRSGDSGRRERFTQDTAIVGAGRLADDALADRPDRTRRHRLGDGLSRCGNRSIGDDAERSVTGCCRIFISAFWPASCCSFTAEPARAGC